MSSANRKRRIIPSKNREFAPTITSETDEKFRVRPYENRINFQ